MKCYECIYMENFGEGFYRCTNHDSMNYMMETGICCEDDCDDGERLCNDDEEGDQE